MAAAAASGVHGVIAAPVAPAKPRPPAHPRGESPRPGRPARPPSRGLQSPQARDAPALVPLQGRGSPSGSCNGSYKATGAFPPRPQTHCGSVHHPPRDLLIESEDHDGPACEAAGGYSIVIL